MSTIKPVRDLVTSAAFDDIIGKQMVTTEDGCSALSTILGIQGASGSTYNVTFGQLSLLMGVILGDHPMLEDRSVLSHMLSLIEFEQEAYAKYVATEYTIDVLATKAQAVVKATFVHPTTLESHPDYDPDLTAKPKELDITISEFGIFQRLLLSAIISVINEQLSHVRGTYDMDYRFTWSSGTIRIEPLSSIESDTSME